MKTLIFIAIVFAGLIAAGCRPTLNVTETNKEQIEEKLINYEQDEGVGAEIEVLLKDGAEINGELLSARDSIFIICTEYSATEKELASLQYPIITVRNDEILELKIEGNSYPFWIGSGIGVAAGTGAFFLVIGDPKELHWVTREEDFEKLVGGCLLGGGLISLGMLIGGLLSTDDVILTDIPPGYKLIPLKSIARYPDKEPEYLKAIQ